MKLSKKMKTAMEDVIRSYDRAIEDLEAGKIYEVVRRWKRYGKFMVCRLCEVAPKNRWETPVCSACPLNTPRNDHRSGCEDGETNIRLVYALRKRKNLVAAFKARRAFIHKRLGENGWLVL